jgi:hypothetical protein
MMALVEHVARRHLGIIQPAPRRLRHHQRMVRHHQLRRARPPDRVLDEAALPVRACGVDALAPPVGQAVHRRRAEQLAEPARQVAALDVAVRRRQRPTRNQAERHRRRRNQAARRPAHRLLIVQQAQVILPPLAHHDTPPPLCRVGIQP